MPKFGPFLSITIGGHRDLMGRFAKATAEVTRARRDEMRDLGRRVVAALQAEAPVRTGRLRRGITFKTFDSGREVKLTIGSAAEYTKYVVRGRGPVVAKNAQALRFVINGQVIFRKRVGPAKPNNFPARAMRKLGNEPLYTARRISARIQNAFSGR